MYAIDDAIYSRRMNLYTTQSANPSPNPIYDTKRCMEMNKNCIRETGTKEWKERNAIESFARVSMREQNKCDEIVRTY
jgi:hypothetical protein